jgi:hypothetical protein
MVSFALASVSAGIVRLYVLTESQDFVRLAVAIAPIVFFGCLLSVRPAIAQHRPEHERDFPGPARAV